MGRPKTAKEAKDRLRSTLGYAEAAFEPIWTQLNDSGWVRDFLEGEEEWADLVREARRWHRFGVRISQADKRRGRSKTQPLIPALGGEEVHRGMALGGYLARIADAKSSVRSFRKKHLGGRVFSDEEAKTFLRSRKAAGSPPGRNDRSKHSLPWTPWASAQQVVAVGTGSILDTLRGLSLELAEEFLWDPGEASWFVLTGTAPQSDPVSMNRRNHIVFSNPEKAGNEPQAAVRRSRITITADDWVSVETVARLYRAMQKMAARADKRALTSKSLSLFMFVNDLRHRRGTSVTWEKIRCSWNACYSEKPMMRFATYRSLRTTYERALREIAFGPTGRRRTGRQQH